MESLDTGHSRLGLPDIGRREALSLGLLGVLGVGTGSALLAGDGGRIKPASHPHHRHLAHTGVHDSAPTPTPTPTPTAPPPVQPIAAWTKPAYKLADIRTDAPPNAVALTIDDGPHPEWTPRVLDLLGRHDVKATFCLIGSQIEENAKVVRMMVEAGHEVANHTWSHPMDIARLSQERVDREIRKAHQRIVEVTATNPRFFRSPGGAWSPEVFRSAAQLGMIPIEWDNDPRDWSRPGTERIVHEMLQAGPGDILLCHDGGGDRSETLRALRTVIPALKGRGLQFVTL